MNLVAKHTGFIIVLTAGLLGIGCSTVQQVPSDTNPVDQSAPVVPAAKQCDITPAIDWMRSQHILYTQSPSDEWRDCSGNFLRLSSRIATICPGLHLAAPPGIKAFVKGGDNQRPGREEARSTRGLARWYDDRDAFIPVYYDATNPLDAPATLVQFRNRIKTGTVLWFSPRVPLSAGGKEGLYAEQGGAINHMGTVISVTRDQAGNVTGWDMYHGQNPRLHNEVTSHLWKRSGRSRPVPQGGYGSQRIVGFAESIIPSAPIQN
jgi:hypothetical protein